MKHSKLLLATIALLHFVGTATAQTVTDFLTPARKIESVSGTVTMSANGVTTRANIRVGTPVSMRLDVQADENALVSAQTIVASGEETRAFDSPTKRVLRLPYNSLDQWWRGWTLPNGGPANAILSGFNAPALDKFYKVSGQAGAAGTFEVSLVAQGEIDRHLIRDDVRSGGVGREKYYAAFKRPVYDRPAKIVLRFSAPNKGLIAREEYDEKGNLLARSEFTLSGDGLPARVITRDGANRMIAEWTYELKTDSGPAPAEAFSMNLAPGQIVEDQVLRPYAEYSAGVDAASKFNQGVVAATHLEDLSLAFTSWDSAANMMPQATAPHFATYEAAMQSRNILRATAAIEQLSGLLGVGSIEVLARRSRLSALQRNWGAMQAALEVAHKAQPTNLGVTLTLANLNRARGEVNTASSLLAEILSSQSPQPTTQVAAAEILAAMTTDKSAASALPPGNLWQSLTRNLALLDTGAAMDASALGIEENSPSADLARSSLALAFERAGNFDAANTLWKYLAEKAPSALANEAQRHVMVIAARRGDTAESLRQYRELARTLPDERSRRGLQNQLFWAWRKAFRQGQLQTALQQRALGTTVSNEDLQFWLAFQETFGTTDDITVAVNLGLAKFPREAWWQSRSAELLAEQAEAQSLLEAGLAARARLYANAGRAIKAAIDLDPQQPYYAAQRALLLLRQATFRAPVQDAGTGVARREAAARALSELQTQWPNDPDMQVVVALGLVALDNKDAATPISLLKRALAGGLPGRESADGNRHSFAFAARQSLASTYRATNQVQPAAEQYELLLNNARDAGEELGIALNYLNLLDTQKDAAGVARLMSRLAVEPWPFPAAQELNSGFGETLLPRRALAAQVGALLRGATRPAEQLAGAQLDLTVASLAKRAANIDNAPVSTVADLREANKALETARTNLERLAAGEDGIVASRAAALLAEDAFGQNQSEKAITYLQTAIKYEPRDLDLRVALATAQLSAGKAEDATATFNALLKTADRDYNSLRRIATLSQRRKDRASVTRFAVGAMNSTQTAPQAGPDEFEEAAFSAARALWNSGDTSRATEIYEQLALPQWDAVDRAVSLLDLESRQRAAGKTAESAALIQRVRALQLNATQLREAQAILEEGG